MNSWITNMLTRWNHILVPQFDGYHKLLIYLPSYHKIAFSYCYEMYQFNVMIYGFCNMPSIFYHIMNTVLFWCCNYLLTQIYSKDIESHKKGSIHCIAMISLTQTIALTWEIYITYYFCWVLGPCDWCKWFLYLISKSKCCSGLAWATYNYQSKTILRLV